MTTKPELRSTSIPANAVYSLLEGLAATLAAFHRRTEDYPLHKAGWDFQQAIAHSRAKACLTPEEDAAFRHLRDRFREMWETYDNPR